MSMKCTCCEEGNDGVGWEKGRLLDFTPGGFLAVNEEEKDAVLRCQGRHATRKKDEDETQDPEVQGCLAREAQASGARERRIGAFCPRG